MKKEKKEKKDKKNIRRAKKKKGNIISTIILVIAACVFVFSLFMLADSLLPYFIGGQEYDDVRKLVIKQETIENEDGETEELFTVDFELLKDQNADTIGWIRFDEPAVISYPIVKSADNSEYLTRTFTANDNKLGTIFMDKNCDSDFTDKNSIIYGHNMQVGGEMFSQLNAYAEESFCKENPYFYIYTPDNMKLTYQIFTAGVVKDTAVNYTLSFANDEEFASYLESCKSASYYSVDADLNADSKIVTLSTCTNIREDERFVVQGVLIEKEDNK